MLDVKRKPISQTNLKCTSMFCQHWSKELTSLPTSWCEMPQGHFRNLVESTCHIYQLCSHWGATALLSIKCTKCLTHNNILFLHRTFDTILLCATNIILQKCSKALYLLCAFACSFRWLNELHFSLQSTISYLNSRKRWHASLICNPSAVDNDSAYSTDKILGFLFSQYLMNSYNIVSHGESLNSKWCMYWHKNAPSSWLIS